MNEMKKNFIRKIEQAAANAFGASVVLQLGINSHKKHAGEYPDAPIIIGAGPPGVSGVRTVKYSPTHRQVQDKLVANRDILYELFLTEIIQYWYDFLSDLYKESVTSNLYGITKYPIPHVKVKISLSASGDELINEIIESACLDFDYLAAKEKLKIIIKILNVDLASVSKELKLLNVNIQVRNILQHRSGIVNLKDLTDLGLHSIDEDHGIKVINIKSGQKVTRTSFDIDNLVDALIIIANNLVA